MGRPISYDRDRILELIQDRFWSNGYSATSLDDIMQSTRLGKGSLYGAYGSKHDMYVTAFADYCDWVVDDYASRMRGPDCAAIGRLKSVVRASAKIGPEPRRGCMLAKSTAEVAGQFNDVDELIGKTFKALEGEILSCVRQAQRAGDIDPRRDTRMIAVTLLAMLRGMEALKRAGLSAASLLQVARGALDFLQPARD